MVEITSEEQNKVKIKIKKKEKAEKYCINEGAS